MPEGSVLRRLLRIEPLENRWLLANVTVSNLNDAVNGNTGSIAQLIATPGADGISLREAIYAANADAAADTINFSVNGTINLSNRPAAEFDHLLISKSLTINGPGSILLTIRAFDPSGVVGNGRRVFEINDSTAGLINVTINDVTITGGDLGAASGGDDGGAGIWNRGENLTVADSVISNNKTQNIGGGIRSNSSGTVSIFNSTISGNSAGNDEFMYGGGIYAGAPAEGTAGNLILIATNITNNSANKGGGVAALVPTAISGAAVTNNTAAFAGGGVWVSYDLTITGSTISGNTAPGVGGGIYAYYGSSINMSYSSVSGNSVTAEGAYGGGIVGGGVITSSTISGNSSAGVGGGVAGAFEINNSTISGNTAEVAGGGVYRFDFDSMVIRHSTISGNTAPAGAGSGIASRSYFSGYEVQIQSSIVAGNTNSDIDKVEGAAATIESLGYNLVGSGTGIGAFSAASGDKIGLNPMLGALANNGGSTATRELLPGSPAIDAGNQAASPGTGTVPQYDQRGAPNSRVKGARIDIGAFESTPVVPPLLGDYNRDAAVSAADYVFWRKTQGTTGLVAYAGADGSGNGTIDPADRTVWRQNFGETGGGGGDAEGDEAANSEVRGASESVGPVAGPLPVAGASLSRAGIDATVFSGAVVQPNARNAANMTWLNLPLAELKSGIGEMAWLNSSSSDEAESEVGLEALDAVFESFASL
jgi:hypothetical protein